jgi:hypothetical protein
MVRRLFETAPSELVNHFRAWHPLSVPVARRGEGKPMAINPWLITWHPSGAAEEARVRNKVAAILHNRTSRADVEQIMRLLYANHYAEGVQVYLSEQVRYARRDYQAKPVRNPINVFTYGNNPFLQARLVHNLVVVQEAGFDVMRWEEDVYRNPPAGAEVEIEEFIRQHPPTRRRMVYITQSNEMRREE